MGVVYVMRGGYGVQIYGGAHEDASWASSRGDMELGSPPLGEEPRMYCMGFPTKGGPRIFPVEGCPGQAVTRTLMRENFLHRHVRDTVVILEEGNLPHPRCP